MFLSPLRYPLRPAAFTYFKQARGIRRPTIKLGKEKFQLSIDVGLFSKDEIRVKARPEYVIIEGKQENKTNNGCVIRRFVRKFKLPEGCSPETMRSKLSPEGILTITADRKMCTTNWPCETAVPIKSGTDDDDEDEFVPTSDSLEKCRPNKKKT